MSSKQKSLRANIQRGVGMIEVLVTLFILSIGLLGAAYLQFVGSFTNSEALIRSQSVLVAQQFSERLRASAYFSPAQTGSIVSNQYLISNNYDFTNFTNVNCNNKSLYDCHCLAFPSELKNCNEKNLNPVNCDADELARFDAYEMSCSALTAHPELKVSLTCTANATSCPVGAKHIIKLSWPVQEWYNIPRTKGPNCILNHDCVTLDVIL